MKKTLCLTFSVLMLGVFNLSAATLYVSRGSMSPSPPYATWATAATNIQDAVNAAGPGDTVLATNGVYSGGVQVSKQIRLLSANGPEFTSIDGGGTNRCISITGPTWMLGFTLTNGWTATDGGAVWSTYGNAFLTNCILSGNCASNGGGAYEATMYNCILTANCASNGSGGAAFVCDLFNCTLTGNSAARGGGAYYAALRNCIIYYNTAPDGSNYGQIWGMTNCCTTPNPGIGEDNITSAPLFVDYAGGNLRLQSISPCVNGGNDFFVSSITDLDDNPRISGGSVDMGAYEFQGASPPSINVQPLSQTVYSGTNVSFNAAANGSLPLSWQWWFKNAAILNATNSSLEVPVVKTNQAGNYFAVVTNALGSVTSQVAVLTVLTAAPSITLLQPLNQTVSPGSNVTLVVGVTGSLPLSWQWGFNGAVIPMATNASLALPGVTTNQAGTYFVVVTNSFGSVTGLVALLSVWTPQANPQPGTKYVWQDSPNPTPPYSSWTSAAHTIYAAVGVSVSADLIMVTNGTYSGGLWVDKPIAIRSINGPQLTTIDGGGTNQCAALANGASLSGFTLTNGMTSDYGGGAEGESTMAFLTNCVLVGNSALYGGGAFDCALYNCTLSGNSAAYGGGASGCVLYNCSLSGNSAGFGGGGEGSTLYNCTLTGNSALNAGGGANRSALSNCIDYFNTSANGQNYDASSTLNYCCTTPLPSLVNGNISLDPQLVDASHLSADSPCRGAGSATYVLGTDLDGDVWHDPPSIGCDEYESGPMTGLLAVGLVPAYTNVAVGFPVRFTGVIEGRAALNAWDFGDGTVVSNRPYASHAWAVPGDYLISFSAFNDANPSGVRATMAIHVAAQPVLYVDATSTNPQPPYATWTTAATNIQEAVDAASVPGALLLVTNGIYAGGIEVNKPMALQSVNGPQFTVIKGKWSGQCLYLTNDSSLSGFTLTNGYAFGRGGGVSCNGPNASLTNCVIVGNRAAEGGGAFGGTLYDCTLGGNSAYSGGAGAYGATLYNCTLTTNQADGSLGGGAEFSLLYNCTLANNSATNGGGADSCILYKCTLSGNLLGGGVNNSTLYNCALTSNSDGGANYSVGGAMNSTLYNCTLTGNSRAGAAFWCKLYNCIVYVNSASGGSNYDDTCTLDYCCTTPLPSSGVGNFTNDPALAGSWRISSSSPCRGAGSAAYASGVDLDGEPWLNPPSIGCDEFYNESLTGPLSLTITASGTNIATGFAINLDGTISGRASESRWEFGDGTVESNRLHTTYQWVTAGEYAVVLRAYNNDYPAGVTATVTIHVLERPVQYVDINSTNPIAPYASWGTAATNIQDAVDAAPGPGALVLVNDGLYRVGGRSVDGYNLNRLSVELPLTVQSLNGPQATVIQGYQVPVVIFGSGAIRCVSLCSRAVLSGFSLMNGASQNGGGIWCQSSSAMVTNCILSGNMAGSGGGAFGGTFYHCTLSTNSASQSGGGAESATLFNCTLTGNATTFEGASGGGTFDCTLNNCTLSGNKSSNGGGVYFGTVNHSILIGNQAQNCGGGAGGATLNNCLLTGNSTVVLGGGGASSCTLNNCTLTGNSSPASLFRYGAGAYNCTLTNCIIYYNPDINYSESTLSHCCTTQLPLSPSGLGNIYNDPLFVDYAGGNLRLQSASPCINAGDNASIFDATDLDGNPRIAGGTVDIGAYEFQISGSTAFYSWLQSYGLPTDGSADYADSDGDGMSNWQEWVSGTDPTNAVSVLRLLSAAPTGTNVLVSWQGVAGINYFLARSTNLGPSIMRGDTNFFTVATNLVGRTGTNTCADTNATSAGPFFYRVGVSGP